jgi:hypothetical protein
MLCAEKSQILNDICDIFNLSQLVKGSTCFKKGCNPPLVDVIYDTKHLSSDLVMYSKKSLFFVDGGLYAPIISDF